MAVGNIYFQNDSFVETIIADNEQGTFLVECAVLGIPQLYRVQYPIADGKHETHKVFYFRQTAEAFYRNKSNKQQARIDAHCFEQAITEFEDIS